MKKSNMFPYYMHVMDQLLPPASAKWAHSLWTVVQNVQDNCLILDLANFSDNAWFHLSGYTNSQKINIWSMENLLYRLQIGVWCIMTKQRIVGWSFSQTPLTLWYNDVFHQQLDRCAHSMAKITSGERVCPNCSPSFQDC
jgi:hypothetical protein